jgi:hypothetical protein
MATNILGSSVRNMLRVTILFWGGP